MDQISTIQVELGAFDYERHNIRCLQDVLFVKTLSNFVIDNELTFVHPFYYNMKNDCDTTYSFDGVLQSYSFELFRYCSNSKIFDDAEEKSVMSIMRRVLIRVRTAGITRTHMQFKLGTHGRFTTTKTFKLDKVD